MNESLTFLPWLRQGLGLGLTARDTGHGSLPRGAAVGAWVEIDSQRAETDVALRPVDHVQGIGTSQILRRFPAPGAVDVEHGYFPLIEFSAPDLPWILTPTGPDEAAGDATSTGRLRPWLVLICVPTALATFTPASGDQAATIHAPAGELPDLDESYGWAHVQSIVDAASTVSATAQPGAVTARLLCPRILMPRTEYRAALVPAFVADGELLVPAWDTAAGTAPNLPLRVYDTWTFETGEVSSFQELCERLGPVPASEALELGTTPLDVTDLGVVEPYHDQRQVTVDYTGALWDAGLTPAGLGRLKSDHDAAVIAVLDQSDHRVVLQRNDPDPVVTPPLYGSLATDVHAVPDQGWMRQLNLPPNRRAAAGLGAAIVREHQERFVAEAWRQAGAIREVNRELSFGRLQAEVARTWQHRAEGLDAVSRLAVFAPQLTFTRTADGHAPRRLVRESSVPNALVARSGLRQLRPGGVVARRVRRREGPELPSWRSALNDRFADPTQRATLGYGVVRRPDGTRSDDPRRYPPAGPFPDLEPPGIPVSGGRPSAAADLDLGAIAALTSTLRPTRTVRDRLEGRIAGLGPALDDHDDEELPGRTFFGPELDEALVWSLIERSPQLLLPGVQHFPDNAVRLVEANPAFVTSFLAGANHEMSRELLWREFPADVGSTTFRRFWDRPDPAIRDIDPVHTWPMDRRLAALSSAEGDAVVVLLRGDLVQQYPSVRVLLVDPADNVAHLPTFAGWLPPDVRFLGFDVADAAAVTDAGSQWRIVIEEQPAEPRFGLNPGEDPSSAPLTSWTQVTWGDVVRDGTHLGIAANSHLAGAGLLAAEAVWGRNSAHLARATYQRPYRLTFLATDLLGGS